MNLRIHTLFALSVVLAAHGLRVGLVAPGSPSYKHMFGATLINNLQLPVWPVHAGVVAQLFDWAGLHDVAEGIVSKVGGRVVPIQMGGGGSSPFLLLAHHQHSFTPLDPIRKITELLLPEGFPAHPHSGFSTLTYTVEGGLAHRDSEGLKMSYGDGDTQWMDAGRGTIHEEMWDVTPDRHQRIELFQLWVNSPSSSKFVAPRVVHLRNSETPLLRCPSSGVTAKVICGSFSLGTSEALGPLSAVTHSPVNVAHVILPPNARVCVTVSEAGRSYPTFMAYTRRGSVGATGLQPGQASRMGDMLSFTPTSPARRGGGGGGDEYEEERIVWADQDQDKGKDKDVPERSAVIFAGNNGAELLLLLGQPLPEPALSNGPFVHASEAGLRRAANAFATLGPGGQVYWDHRLDDMQWKKHCRDLDVQGKLSAFFP